MPFKNRTEQTVHIYWGPFTSRKISPAYKIKGLLIDARYSYQWSTTGSGDSIKTCLTQSTNIKPLISRFDVG